MLGESDIIALFQTNPQRLDDCAVLPRGPEGGFLLVTTDVLAEETHFRTAWSTPEDLAARLFYCNHSDLCASGAPAPVGCLLQLGLPERPADDFVRRFAAQLRRLLSAHGCPLLGGDTYRSERINLGLTLWGHTSRVIARQGGRPGDTLYVTGPLGLSALGLHLLAEGARPPLEAGDELQRSALQRFLRGQSRPDWAALATLDTRVHAALDISDGLRTDAQRLAAASGLHLFVELSAVPLPAEYPLGLSGAVDSGEEFEILFLAEAGLETEYDAIAIGRAEASGSGGRTLTFEQRGRPTELPGVPFRHFAGSR